MIEYRLATPNDFDAVQAIENECFKEPYSTADLRYEFEENPVNKIIVAEDEGKVIGFIDFLITFNSSTISLLKARNITSLSLSFKRLQAETIVVVLPLPATALMAMFSLPFSTALKMSN